MRVRNPVVAMLTVVVVLLVATCVVLNYSENSSAEMTENIPESTTVCDSENLEAWQYPITQEEIDLIALVTMGEAEGETELGKRLVIDTILNRVDHASFPDNVHDVIYQPNQFTPVWNGRLERCRVTPEIEELVKSELMNRTNYECVFFMAGDYNEYGKPMFRECNHYFSSYE